MGRIDDVEVEDGMLVEGGMMVEDGMLREVSTPEMDPPAMGVTRK